MEENIQELAPADKLRALLSQQAKTPHGIANQMPGIYGVFRVLKAGNEKYSQAAEQELGEKAKEFDLDSVAELKAAIDGLREQLKSELSQEHWKQYFEDSMDI